MNCHHLRDALIDHARGALTGSGSIAAVESHLERCSACAAEHARQLSLSEGLRALVAASSQEAAPDALQLRLAQTFARECGKPALNRISRRAAAGWLAVAASLVFVVGAAVRLRTGTRIDVRLAPDATKVTRLTETTTATGEPARTVPAADGPNRDTSRMRDRRTTATASGLRPKPRPVPQPVSSIDDFTPLPGAIGLPAFESGRVVRVDLPVSSLPAYGVELVPDTARTEVQADVLVGQDGQARAIRLVTVGHER